MPTIGKRHRRRSIRPTWPWRIDGSSSLHQGLRGFWPIGSGAPLDFHLNLKHTITLGDGADPALTPATTEYGRTFTLDGSNDALESDTETIGVPVSFSALLRTDNNTTHQVAWSQGRSVSSTGHMQLSYLGDSTDKYRFLLERDTSGSTFVYSDNAQADTNWHHVVAMVTAAGSVRLSFDGVCGSFSSAFTPPSVDRFAIGCHLRNSAVKYWSGNIIRAGVWNRVLDDSECKRLFDNAGLPDVEEETSRVWFLPAAGVGGIAPAVGLYHHRHHNRAN